MGLSVLAAVLGSDLLSQELDLLIYEEGEGKRPKFLFKKSFYSFLIRERTISMSTCHLIIYLNLQDLLP